jgi:transcriptional regulator with XRE-family HTH domain
MSRRPSDAQLLRELVGRNIVRARTEAGLSGAQLAAKLEVERGAVSGWENGRKLCSPAYLNAISDATGHDHDLGWFYSEHEDDGE